MSLNFGLLSPDKEKATANYDFIDIARNVAITVFYPGQSYDETTKQYSLSNLIFQSGRNSAYAETTAGSNEKIIDITFEALIGAPFQIQGTVILNVPMNIDSTEGSSDYTMKGFISGAVLISGATLTTAGTFKSQTQTAASETNNETMMAVRFHTNTQKIKAGEYIQLKLEGWGETSVAGGGRTGKMWLGYDPSNSGVNGEETDPQFAFTTAGSQSKLLLPIKIDL